MLIYYVCDLLNDVNTEKRVKANTCVKILIVIDSEEWEFGSMFFSLLYVFAA